VHQPGTTATQRSRHARELGLWIGEIACLIRKVQKDNDDQALLILPAVYTDYMQAAAPNALTL